MTFLGLEKPIEYGRQLIFDPSTALFVLDAQRLYAAALYNDYKQSLNDMKEFREKYGDFMTPILADQNWWNLHVNDPVKNLINDAYANGVDLLRSPLGRAMVSNLIASMPYGQMAFKRQRAKNAEEYYKNMAILQRENKFDKAFSEYLKEDPNLWDPNSAGVTSPTVYQTMDDIIEPIVKNLKPSYDEALTKQMNDGFDYKTVSRDRILLTIDDKMEDLMNTSIGGYYYKKAYDAVGGDKEAAKALLKEWYANRASDHVLTDREANPYRLDAARTANDMKQYSQKAALDYYYDELALKDLNGDRKIDDNENKLYEEYIKENGYRSSRNGNGRQSEYYNIFDSAREDSGVDKSYTVGAEAENYIAPVNNSIGMMLTKGKQWVYRIPGSEIDKVLYTEYSTSHSGPLFKYNGHGGEFDKTKEYIFVPNGGLRHKRVNGKDRYFIGGTIHESVNGVTGKSPYGYKDHGTITYEMEVIENDHTYAKKKAK